MKKLNFILFFGLLTFTSFSQKNKHYTSYIGVNVQPSHYWLYNKDEFTAPDTLFGVKNDSVFINSFAYGLSYGHFFKKSFGINIGLQYSTQTQYYEFDYNPESSNGNWRCHTNLKYLKLPISLTHRKSLSENKFFTFSLGIQTSFLTYAIDDAKMSIYPDGFYEYIIKNNNTVSNDSIVYFADWKYKRLVFGTNMSIGYEQYINQKMSFSVSFNADYSITNVDNLNALAYGYSKDSSGNLDRFYPNLMIIWNMYRHGYHSIQYDRKPSHNIHLGLEFGFKYWFGEKTLILKRKVPREW